MANRFDNMVHSLLRKLHSRSQGHRARLQMPLGVAVYLIVTGAVFAIFGLLLAFSDTTLWPTSTLAKATLGLVMAGFLNVAAGGILLVAGDSDGLKAAGGGA